MYITNAFSLQMLSLWNGIAKVEVKEISAAEVAEHELVSAIGHADTANVISNIIGINLPMNRINIRLNPGESAIVAQVMGGRLPEGATTLPEGITIKFFMVNILVPSYCDEVENGQI